MTTNDNAPDPRKHSIVGGDYKARYRERAENGRGKKGVDKRVLSQSNNDWLAQELAARVRPSAKARLDIPKLEAIFDANGVEHSHLSRTSPGWQGKLRMTGGLALRTVVANNGELVVPGKGSLAAPKAWCARWTK